MPKRLFAIAVCIFVALAAVALWLGRENPTSAQPSEKSSVQPNEIAASVGAVYTAKFPDLQGNFQALGQWDRKLLVLNFWATWCGPCTEEIPILAKLQSKFGARGLQIVGIAADSATNVSSFAQTTAINYPLLMDEAGALQLSKRLGNRLGLLPHTVMFGPGGEIIYTKLGAISEIELDLIISKNILNVR